MATVHKAILLCDGCGRTLTADEACPNCTQASVASVLRSAANTHVPLPPQMRTEESGQVATDREVAASTNDAEVTVDSLFEFKPVAEQVSNSAHGCGTAVHSNVNGSAEILVCTNCNNESQGTFTFCLHCGGSEFAVIPESTGHVVRAKPTKKLTFESGLEVVVHLLTGMFHSLQASKNATSWMNALLSFFVPGTGQLLAGQAAKGIVLMLAVQFCIYNLHWPAFGIVLLILRALFALDAYRISELRRRGRRVRDWDWNFRI